MVARKVPVMPSVKIESPSISYPIDRRKFPVLSWNEFVARAVSAAWARARSSVPLTAASALAGAWSRNASREDRSM